VAAALSIPLTTSSGTALPDRDLVPLLTIAVIVITLIVQRFTLAPLVRRAGITLTASDVRQEHTSARLHLARAGLSHLNHVTEQNRPRIRHRTAPQQLAGPYRAY
jgi:monovalent cation/hydrogen antiporter